MVGFTEILRSATREVPDEYFLLPLHGADPIYRERVYCYELYHQLRSLWPIETPYRLNGEVDKRNHPYFQDEEQPKPDFLVHRPGLRENYGAIEVKPAGAANRETTKDLSTLTLLSRRAGYQRLIYLIYGEDAERDVKRIRTCAAGMNDLPPMELWLHLASGVPAVMVGVLNLEERGKVEDNGAEAR